MTVENLRGKSGDVPRPRSVGDVMTREVVSVGPQAGYTEIRAAMLKHDVGGLPVVGADGVLLGMVTEADLIAKEAYRASGRGRRMFDRFRRRDTNWAAKAAGRTAADLMTPHVESVAPGDDLRAVARRMLQRRLKRMPVLDEGRVVGIVARQDLLRPFARTDAELAVDVEAALADPTLPTELAVLCQVTDGVVHLWGSVRVPADLPAVLTAVTRIPGVVAVDSQLFPRDPNPGGRL